MMLLICFLTLSLFVLFKLLESLQHIPTTRNWNTRMPSGAIQSEGNVNTIIVKMKEDVDNVCIEFYFWPH